MECGPSLLKGSWDLATRVIIRVTILITPIKVLITLLTKSHDPPSRLQRGTRSVARGSLEAPLRPPGLQGFTV